MSLLTPNFGAGIRRTDYIYLAATVIVLYDHALTIGDEIELVWKRTNRPWLYYIHRYFALVNMVGMTTLLYLGKQQTCKVAFTLRNAFLIASQLIVYVILLLRTRALYGGDRRILWFGLVSAILLLGLCLGIFFLKDSEPARIYLPHSVCTPPPLSRSAAAVTSLPWIGLLVYDIAIVAMTIWKTMQTARDVSIIGVMLRDGALYFCAMAVCNLANILSINVAPQIFPRGSLAPLTSGISVTLASRLMLNVLRAGRIGQTHASTTSHASIEFSTIYGSRANHLRTDDVEIVPT